MSIDDIARVIQQKAAQMEMQAVLTEVGIKSVEGMFKDARKR